MNYNFSSSPRVGSCIPTRTACTTDPRYHHNFDPHCHNHFNPHCHDHFDPCCDGLELNIQLPDIKIPPRPDVKCPEVKIPPCPDVKCPDVEIPPCPECPACPEPKPDTGTDIGTKPKAKEPFDMGKLAILTPSGEDEILDVITNKRTGLYSKQCGDVIKNTKNDLEILNGKIVGKCYDSPECDKCVDALNSGIIRVLSSEDQPFFSDHSIPTLEGNVYIL